MKKQKLITMNALSSIFGSIPENAIFNPEQPYSIRLNCQAGQLAIGDDKFIGKEAEISIIKISRFFGTLGLTKNTEWLQIFFIAAPNCTIIPKNTVCVTYIKTRSLGAFNQSVIELLSSGKNPAEGIFKIGFQLHQGTTQDGQPSKYYSVTFDWRERDKAETDQLKLIADFMEGQPTLLDGRVTSLICLENLPKEEKEALLLGSY